MNAARSSDSRRFIFWVYAILLLYNGCYWIAKFFNRQEGGLLEKFYRGIINHWWLFVLLEFLAVAGIFVEVIVRFDQLSGRIGKLTLILTVMLFAAFVARLILGVIDLYMLGYIH